MAFRAVARRWPAASQMRTGLQGRRYSTQPEYTGNALSEKEKAAENRYIRNLEQEHRAAAAGKATTEAAAGSTSLPVEALSAPPLPTVVSEETGYRNTAVLAGLVAFVSGYWLLSGPSKKAVKEEKEGKEEKDVA